MGAAFDQRDPPRTAAFESFGESLKKNWVLLAVIAIGLVLVLLWRKMNRQNESVPVQQPAPPPPTTRPPYNPETHGTLEQYRATYGHLPAHGGV